MSAIKSEFLWMEKMENERNRPFCRAWSATLIPSPPRRMADVKAFFWHIKRQRWWQPVVCKWATTRGKKTAVEWQWNGRGMAGEWQGNGRGMAGEWQGNGSGMAMAWQWRGNGVAMAWQWSCKGVAMEGRGNWEEEARSDVYTRRCESKLKWKTRQWHDLLVSGSHWSNWWHWPRGTFFVRKCRCSERSSLIGGRGGRGGRWLVRGLLWPLLTLSRVKLLRAPFPQCRSTTPQRPHSFPFSTRF